MAHLSELTTDYIREKFAETILEQEAQSIINELDKLIQALKHRPFNPLDPGYISFIEVQFEKLEQLKLKYPFVGFNSLARKFHEKIIN